MSSDPIKPPFNVDWCHTGVHLVVTDQPLALNMRNIIENEKSPRKNLGSSYSKKSVEKKFSKSDVLKTNVIPGKSKFGRYQFRECKNANLRITTFLRTYNSGNFLENSTG